MPTLSQSSLSVRSVELDTPGRVITMTEVERVPLAKDTTQAESESAKAFARMRQVMSLSKDRDERKGTEIAQDIAARILAADSIEGVFEGREGLMHSEAILDREVEVISVRFGESDYEGIGYYAIIECSDIRSGVMQTVSVGGTNPVVQLFKLDQLDAFPIGLILRQTDKPSKSGKFPQFFVRA